MEPLLQLDPGSRVLSPIVTPNLVGVVAQAIEGGLSAGDRSGRRSRKRRPIHHWASVPISRGHSQLAHTGRYAHVLVTSKNCAEVAKIPPRRLHDLRHSAATMMLDNDLDLKTVGQLLGGLGRMLADTALLPRTGCPEVLAERFDSSLGPR